LLFRVSALEGHTNVEYENKAIELEISMPNASHLNLEKAMEKMKSNAFFDE
jgi:hypothetical protein